MQSARAGRAAAPTNRVPGTVSVAAGVSDHVWKIEEIVALLP
jgi:hypothetical protein